ncbi:hypothetical protein [Krasilnikovia sp. M28-CT-15]|uniref:RipA family octameric membrane protein n=1 Tax=Krasilnikovia sp. M28-CT-15 TaxID=3373540 RepID=UPI0038770CBC
MAADMFGEAVQLTVDVDRYPASVSRGTRTVAVVNHHATRVYMKVDSFDTIANAWHHGVMGQSNAGGGPPSPEDQRDSANRLWQHLMHEDNQLIQRGNFYLVSESMLLVAFSLLKKGPPAHTSSIDATKAIAMFGLVLTAAWTYGGYRQLRYFRNIRQWALLKLPEYEITWSQTKMRGPSSTAILVYGIPMFAVTVWVILLAV